MSGLLQQLAVALFAAFVLWLSNRVFYQRRLYYVVQNLFHHSKISDGGTVEIVVANLGRRAEEEIELGLMPGLRYELVAATSPSIEITDGRVIRIPRLAPKQQLTLLILAEGNQRFDAGHITGLSSREAIGRSAKDMSEANSSDPLAAIGGLILLSGFVAIGAGAGYFFGKEQAEAQALRSSSPQTTTNEVARIEQPFRLGCVDFSSNGDKRLNDDLLRNAAVASTRITKVYRQGDRVIADVQLENLVSGETEYQVKLQSPASDSSTDILLRADSFVYDIILMEKGATKDVTVSNYLPEKYKPQVFWIESRLEIPGGYWVTYRQRVSFGPDANLTCPAGDGV